MENIFITGVSGYFGSKLVALFDQNESVYARELNSPPARSAAPRAPMI